MGEIIFKDLNYIDDSIIKSLNDVAEEVMKQQKKYKISYDFIEKALLYYINNNDYKEMTMLSNVKPLKKWGIISLALDFFKSIDFEIYKKIKDIIFSQNSKIRINIYKLSETENLNERDCEFKEFKKYSKAPINYVKNNKDVIYLPLKVGWRYNKEESKLLEKDEGSIYDLYALVHELAHTLDIYLEYIINKDSFIISSDIYDARNNICSESIAIAFERLLTDYLLKKKIVNAKDIENILIQRKNDTLNKCYFTYTKLVLARKKQGNDIITKKDIEEIANNMGFNEKGKNELVDIVKSKLKENFLTDAGYALSGMLSPTIEKLVKQGEIEKVKECLETSRIGNFESSLEALGITLDANGLKKLQDNMLEQRFEFEKDKDKNERI